MECFRWCLLIASAVPLGLGSTMLSTDAANSIGSSLFLWEDEDRYREMERRAGDASHFLCIVN